MISLKTCLAIFAVLPVGVYARECTTTTNNTPLTISEPSDLIVFDGCTSIIGDITIDTSFSGSFILNGVTHFNGSISMDENVWANDILAIEMVDLVEITRLNLPQSWGLKSLNLMNVQHVEELSFIQGVQDGAFNLDALKTARNIEIAGLWTSIALPALETVDSLTIATDPSWKPTPRAPLRIHLPSLREAGWMSIRGYVSRLETPELKTLGTPDSTETETERSGMEVHANYTDLEGVELVALQKLFGALVLEGFISGVSLGVMAETNATITIHSSSSIWVSSSLEIAGVMDISGELETLNLVNLVSAQSLTIESTTTTTCPSNLIEIYENLNSPSKATFCDDGPTSTSTSNLGDALDDLLDDDDSSGYTIPSFDDLYGDSDSSSSSSPRNHGIPTAVIVCIPLFTFCGCMIAVFCCVTKCGKRRESRELREAVAHERGRGGNIGAARTGAGDVETAVQVVQPAVVRDRYTTGHGHGQGAGAGAGDARPYGLYETTDDLPPAYSVDTPTRERSRYF
ncbi:hypothetical protein BJX66DRAFT_315860 [Aspergillus keveii]|uniref:GPI-anchored cell wall organization protein Ecm33 n=1 Tax=Aspergillus keveii TaxID=714993 RepID=A0ABR4FNZ4_9EURO